MTKTWLVYAVIAMLLLAFADFMLGALNKKFKPPVSTFTLNVFAYAYMASLSVALFLASEGYFGKPNSFLEEVAKGMAKIRKGEAMTWVLVPAVAICYLLGNRFLWQTYKTAPGIGLAEAAGSLSSGVVLILTAVLFGVKFKAVNVVGIIISILGLALLSGRVHFPKF